MSVPNPQAFRFGIVLLAAGRSTRMGRQKMLLPWEGTSVIGHLIQQWTRLGGAQIATVIAADDAPIIAELDRLNFPRQNHIFNPAPERGMFSSIECAAAWDGWSPGLTHWAVVLGDQPHLHAETLRTLLIFAAQTPGKVCQPSRAQRPKHPVLLPRPVFLALISARAGTLKEFLARFEVALCEIDDPGLELDIDQPEDYERALRLDGRMSGEGARVG